MTPMAARTGEFLLSEADGTLSREAVVITSGAGNLAAGSVLGRITKRQAAAPIPTIVGTGTGVMSGLTFGPDVQVGSYVITLLATSATAAFSVVAPNGTALPNGAVATAYKSNHISFLIANGGTMTLGDYLNIVVAGYTAPIASLWDPLAVTGVQEPWGILYAATDASSAAQDAVAITRLAEINTAKLAWKSTVTAAQKAEAYRQLAAANVIARS
jgi:hypothetical protein